MPHKKTPSLLPQSHKEGNEKELWASERAITSLCRKPKPSVRDLLPRGTGWAKWDRVAGFIAGSKVRAKGEREVDWRVGKPWTVESHTGSEVGCMPQGLPWNLPRPPSLSSRQWGWAATAQVPGRRLAHSWHFTTTVVTVTVIWGLRELLRGKQNR